MLAFSLFFSWLHHYPTEIRVWFSRIMTVTWTCLKKRKKRELSIFFPTPGDFHFVPIKHGLTLIAFANLWVRPHWEWGLCGPLFLQSLSLLVMPDSTRFLFLLKMNPKPGVYTSPSYLTVDFTSSNAASQGNPIALQHCPISCKMKI